VFVSTDTVRDRSAPGIGTEENPLVHPVTGERLVFRKRSRDTGGELLEFDLLLAPGGFIAAEHVHPNQEERFEIDGAELMFRVGGVERLYRPGDVGVVPAGVAHTLWNPSQVEAATVIQLRPALDMETVFETLFGLAADGKVNAKGLPNPLHMMVLARAYRREVQAAPPMGWIVGPLSIVLAPVGRLLGFRARYDRYSGPLLTDGDATGTSARS
jgi:quercetin dioxygenase-like cupin family protein